MKQMTVQVKIIVGIFIVILMAVLAGGIESIKTRQASQKVQDIANIHLPLTQIVSTADQARADQRSAVVEARAGSVDLADPRIVAAVGSQVGANRLRVTTSRWRVRPIASRATNTGRRGKKACAAWARQGG